MLGPVVLAAAHAARPARLARPGPLDEWEAPEDVDYNGKTTTTERGVSPW